jgi:hypothetical protein
VAGRMRVPSPPAKTTHSIANLSAGTFGEHSQGRSVHGRVCIPP